MQLLMSQRTCSTSRRVVTILQYHVIIMYTAGFFYFVLINYVLGFNHLFQIIIHNYIFTIILYYYFILLYFVRWRERWGVSSFIHPSVCLSIRPSFYLSIVYLPLWHLLNISWRNNIWYIGQSLRKSPF